MSSVFPFTEHSVALRYSLQFRRRAGTATRGRVRVTTYATTCSHDPVIAEVRRVDE